VGACRQVAGAPLHSVLGVIITVIFAAELFTAATHLQLPPPGHYVSFMPPYNPVCPLFRGLLQRKKQQCVFIRQNGTKVGEKLIRVV